MRLAYEQRDSVRTGLIYAPDYRGESQDLNDPNNPNPVYYTHDDEVHHVGGLFRNVSISSVTFTMGSPDAWVRESSDDANHPDWALIETKSHKVDVVDGLTEWVASDATTFRFYFSPTPDASSATDTTWLISRWVEVVQVK